jgi:hypothetical protein
MERAAKKWVANRLLSKPDEDEAKARAVWDALSPEIKAHLMVISETDDKQTRVVATRLLAVLDAYTEPDHVKEPFKRAILNIHELL